MKHPTAGTAVAVALAAAVALAPRQQARAQVFLLPPLEVDVASCVHPVPTPVRDAVERLTAQLDDIGLSLAMHAANRAEALRRTDPDEAYAAKLRAALEADQARLASLEQELACWRALIDEILERYDDPDYDPTIVPWRPPFEPFPAMAGDIELEAIVTLIIHDLRLVAEQIDAVREPRRLPFLADTIALAGQLLASPIWESTGDDTRDSRIGPTGDSRTEPETASGTADRQEAADAFDAAHEAFLDIPAVGPAADE